MNDQAVLFGSALYTPTHSEMAVGAAVGLTGLPVGIDVGLADTPCNGEAVVFTGK